MKELIELLMRFQQAYVERDLNRAERFVEDTFIRSDPVYYSTSPAEECVGAGRILRLIGYDWTVWGDLKLDFDSLTAHDHGGIYDFMLTGCVDWQIDRESFLSRAMMDVKDMVLRGGESEELLREINTISAKMLMEAQRGERHILPIRLSGVAVHEDEKLKFSQLHLSHPVQNYPDCRIYRD